jgi:Family of unknown function (DUF6301)
MLSDEQIADAVARLSRVRWSWSVADVDGLAAQLGWQEIDRNFPDAATLSTQYGWRVDADLVLGTVHLRTGYPADSGRATVYFQGKVAGSVALPATVLFDRRFPDRVDAFATVVAAASNLLGPPPYRRPGQHADVCWPATDGLVCVSDNGGSISLELRSAQMEERFGAGRERDLERRRFEALNGDEEEDNVLGYPW